MKSTNEKYETIDKKTLSAEFNNGIIKDVINGEYFTEWLTGLLNQNIIRKIDLGGNKITDEGARAIAEAIAKVIAHNTSLNSINLRSNQITDEGARDLSNALVGNASLKSIDLSFNKITDKGAEVIAEVIAHNTSLNSIILLSFGGIGYDGAYKFFEALKTNDTTEVELSIGGFIGNAISCLSKANQILSSIEKEFNKNDSFMLNKLKFFITAKFVIKTIKKSIDEEKTEEANKYLNAIKEQIEYIEKDGITESFKKITEIAKNYIETKSIIEKIEDIKYRTKIEKNKFLNLNFNLKDLIFKHLDKESINEIIEIFFRFQPKSQESNKAISDVNYDNKANDQQVVLNDINQKNVDITDHQMDLSGNDQQGSTGLDYAG